MASVVMKALIRNRVMITPLTRPTTRPERVPSAMATSGLAPRSRIAIAETMPPRPSTAPTETSMPPARITSV
jgi:hypothetical protein